MVNKEECAYRNQRVADVLWPRETDGTTRVLVRLVNGLVANTAIIGEVQGRSSSLIYNLCLLIVMATGVNFWVYVKSTVPTSLRMQLECQAGK